ncbi:MAG TPA: trigger factor family protein, partial [Ktedonobacterales bacterium]
MKVTVERTDNSEAILNVELDWTELESASNLAFPKLARRYNVPGFRPGKAPRSMLERMLGKEAIYQNGLEGLIEKSYRDALQQNELVPLAEPTLDAPPLQLNEPYSYTARVAVLSPVTLGDYHAVKVDYPTVNVTDEDVDKVLADLQQQHAVWLPTEEAAQLGHHVIVDLKLTVGDRPV